jgi:malate dehydrogenase (oxaloacetate-decarboxylating)
LLAAINVTGKPLKEQRIAMLGFGSAGVGIASLMVTAMVEAGLSQDEARGRVYAVDKDGLLVEGYADLHPTQQPFVKKALRRCRMEACPSGQIGLLDVIQNAKPTVLIGVSGQPGVFTEEMVRAMTSMRAADHLPALQSHLPQRGHASGSARLVEWRSGDRHRQPLSAGFGERPVDPDRPNQQLWDQIGDDRDRVGPGLDHSGAIGPEFL